MLNLPNTSALIEVVSVSTVVLDVHASWVDFTSPSTFAPNGGNVTISTATTTTIVGSPSGSTIRNVKTIFVVNTDGTNSEVVTVRHYDGSIFSTIWAGTLQAGDTLQYEEDDGFMVIDKTGARKIAAATGRFVKNTTLTISSGSTFTTGPLTNTIRIRGTGGGGGGAGCTSVAAAASYGGGGGGAGYVEKTFSVTPNTAYSFTCGAAGSNASGAAGGNGGNSTFVVGAVTVTAFGGGGAPIATAVTTTPQAYLGGAGGVISTNGDLNAAGESGSYGNMTAITPVGVSGSGGSSVWGGGGAAITAVGNGAGAVGFGAGGGGAATGASTARAGGLPVPGAWVVEEYT